jgi:hypothetical protein
MSELLASGRLALAVAATTTFADDMPPFKITKKAGTVARSSQGASLDSGAFAEDAVLADPAVDPATVVPNLKPISLDRLYQMQVVPTVHLAQHDVAHLQGRRDHRLDRTQLPGLDSTPHRVPPGPEVNGFPVLEAGDILGSPSHAVSFHESAQQGE